jgi:hypothetical protein
VNGSLSITSKSPEAIEHLKKGEVLLVNSRGTAAAAEFAEALKLDPDFTLAHGARALSARHAAVGNQDYAAAIWPCARRSSSIASPALSWALAQRRQRTNVAGDLVVLPLCIAAVTLRSIRASLPERRMRHCIDQGAAFLVVGVCPMHRLLIHSAVVIAAAIALWSARVGAQTAGTPERFTALAVK